MPGNIPICGLSSLRDCLDTGRYSCVHASAKADKGRVCTVQVHRLYNIQDVQYIRATSFQSQTIPNPAPSVHMHYHDPGSWHGRLEMSTQQLQSMQELWPRSSRLTALAAHSWFSHFHSSHYDLLFLLSQISNLHLWGTQNFFFYICVPNSN